MKNNLVCSVNIYGPEAYKVGEICNPNSKYVWFLYNASNVTEEVKGKLQNGKIKVGDKIYVGLKSHGSRLVLVARDGVIRDIKYTADSVNVGVLLNPYIPRDYSIDFFVVQVGNAAKDKLFMYGD